MNSETGIWSRDYSVQHTNNLDDKLNILIAIESFFDGGAEMFAIRLANALAETQHVFFIELYPDRSKEKRQLELLDKGIPLFQPLDPALYQNAGKRPFLPLRLARKPEGSYEKNREKEITKFIKRNKITVVNSHSWDSDVYFAQLKKDIKFRLVSSFHGHYEFLGGMREGFAAATRSALAATDTVIYTSPKHQQTLDEYDFPKERRKKIFYGVSMALSEQTTRYEKGGRLHLVLAARGIKEKGWKETIEAVLMLKEKYPGILQLTLAGEGDYLNELKQQYHDPVIIFLGYVENVRAVVNEAHIGLLPSFYIAESLPNTVIEYLFCGKPVITTNIGAIREMIGHGSELAGTCIELQNGKPDAALIADAIEKYICCPELVEQDSAIALKAAKKFTMQTCIENYLEVFSTSAA